MHERNALSSQRNYLRVRGEYPKRFGLIHPARGTTSACAENTAKTLLPHHSSGNYLRVRGEYGVPGHMMDMDEELPPRARRILFLSENVTPNSGTTSACAENTLNELGLL